MRDILGPGDVAHSSEIGEHEEGWFYLDEHGRHIGPFPTEEAAEQAPGRPRPGRR